MTRAKGKLTEGATVHVNGATSLTNAQDFAQFQTPAATYRVYACKHGLVRSLSEPVVVK